MENALAVDTALPGGNAGLLRAKGDDVWFAPDLRDTEGWWFYWSFRVRGAAGRTLRFHGAAPDGGTSPGPLLASRGPAFSRDCGASWQWLGPAANGTDFTFAFGPGDHEVWFGLGMNYTRRDWLGFTAPWRGRVTVLTTAGGEPMEALRMGCGTGARQRVMVLARHHACEMMANHVMEGMAAALGEAETAGVEFLFVPFMDTRGVANGDQGKNRRPRDHNRDYGAALHPEVAALKRVAREWGRGRLAAVLDLHCPWIRGGRNETVFQVRGEWCENAQARFADILERVQQAGTSYRAADDMPWGREWNSAADGLVRCSEWMSHPSGGGAALASTIEIPYAESRGAVMDAARCRAFGGDLARALGEWLRTGTARRANARGCEARI